MQLIAWALALVWAGLTWWLIRDDDADDGRPWPRPAGSYHPAGCGVGEWAFGQGPHQRVLVTRRLPAWVHRTCPN